ncbi:MAG: hypothetical protein HY720_16090 [Planctomycetes bacterium]|nr:hypothetical protein [Planctomycetota bacterium]
MIGAVAIPTRGRPRNVALLLDELVAQRREYGHEVTIHIFDQSDLDETRSVALERARDGVRYHGREERARLAEILSSRLGFDPPSVAAVLGRGYGGNRNFAHASLAGRRVVSIDDDVMPRSLRGAPRRAPEPPANGDRRVLGYGEFARPEAVREERYDFLGAILGPIGRLPAEASLPTASGIEIRDLGDGSKEYLARTDGPVLDKPIVMAAPQISGEPDLLAEAVDERGVWTFRDFHSAVFEHVLAGATCYAADLAVLGDVPFAPTDLRCEDGLFQLLVNAHGRGLFAYLGEDVVHRRGPRPPTSRRRAFLDEVAAIALMHLVRSAMWRTDSLAGLGEGLKTEGSRAPTIRDALEWAGERLASLAPKAPATPGERSELEARVRVEVEATAACYSIWERLSRILLADPIP